MSADRVPTWAGLAGRAIAGGVFLYSAVEKIADGPEVFAYAMEGFKLFPQAALLPFARVFPWVELVLGLALLAGFRTRPAGAASAGLFLAFTALFLVTAARGIDVANCGCFGSSGPHLSIAQAVTLDLILAACAAAAAAAGARRWSLDGMES